MIPLGPAGTCGALGALDALLGRQAGAADPPAPLAPLAGAEAGGDRPPDAPKTVEILTDTDRELLRAVSSRLTAIPDELQRHVEQRVNELAKAAVDRLIDSAQGYAHAVVERSRREFAGLIEKKGLARLVEKLERVSAAPAPPVTSPVARRPAPAAPPASVERPVGGPVGSLPGPEQRILNAVAELQILGLHPADKIQVGLLAGYTNVRSGGFSEPLGRLVAQGFVVSPQPGKLAITDAGVATAFTAAAPSTSAEMQERVLAKLTGPEQKLLRVLLDRYPRAITKQDLGDACGYTNIRSGGFSEPLGRLNTLGIVQTPERGSVVAAPFLFLEVA